MDIRCINNFEIVLFTSATPRI